MQSVLRVILQLGSSIKVRIELPVATRHHRYMTDKLFKSNVKPEHYIYSLNNMLIYPQNLCEPFKDVIKKKNMSLVVRKPVFGVSDQVRHKPSCTATEDG